MTPAQVLAAGAAGLVVLGIVLIGLGLRPGSAVRAPGTAPANVTRAQAVRPLAAAGVGLAAWLLSGWPALGVAAAAAAVGLPAVVGADRRAQEQIDRIEAVEEWARRVADILAIGVGLEQALTGAARTAPAAVAEPAATVAARIAARAPTETALRHMADELADPASDLVIAALILAARRRGPGVAAALTGIADSVGEEVAARRRIEADRAKPRATARAVTIITVVIIGVGLMNGAYTAPYGTALGQLVLAATLGFFGAALWWMHRMTVAVGPGRLLAEAES
jgi:Flp pilus assembly protein TadB